MVLGLKLMGKPTISKDFLSYSGLGLNPKEKVKALKVISKTARRLTIQQPVGAVHFWMPSATIPDTASSTPSSFRLSGGIQPVFKSVFLYTISSIRS